MSPKNKENILYVLKEVISPVERRLPLLREMGTFIGETSSMKENSLFFCFFYLEAH